MKTLTLAGVPQTGIHTNLVVILADFFNTLVLREARPDSRW